jgi:anti-anti-sigma regulatory factor
VTHLPTQSNTLERTVAIVLLASLAVITGALAPVVWFRGDAASTLFFGTVIASLIFAGLLFAYMRGWGYAPLVVTVMLAILPGTFLDELTPGSVVAAFTAPAVGMIFLSAPWIALAGFISLTGLLIRTGSLFSTDNLTLILNSILVIGALAIARQVLDEAQRRTLASAEEARVAQMRAETANASIQEANSQLQQQTDQQQRLIDLLNDLEVPAITIGEGVLLMPVIGNLDTRRAARLMEGVLGAVYQQRARLLIFDIAGMTIADTASVQALHRAVEAVQLLGCTVKISGMRAEVAQTLVRSQVMMPDVQFVQRLADALDQQVVASKR